MSDLVSVCFEVWCYRVQRVQEPKYNSLKINASAIPCDAMQSAKSRETVPKSGASANFATFAFDYKGVTGTCFWCPFASENNEAIERCLVTVRTQAAYLRDICIVSWPMSCAVEAMYVPQDSRKSCEGSRARARRAGIQVAIRPRSVIVTMTPPRTKGSPGVANETMCARMRPVSNPPAMPRADPHRSTRAGRPSVERITWTRCAPKAIRMACSLIR